MAEDPSTALVVVLFSFLSILIVLGRGFAHILQRASVPTIFTNVQIEHVQGVAAAEVETGEDEIRGEPHIEQATSNSRMLS